MVETLEGRAERGRVGHPRETRRIGRYQFRMNSSDLQRSISSSPVLKGRKPYVAPTYKRVTPDAAKELLLRHADTSDPEVQHMLDRIEELQKYTGS